MSSAIQLPVEGPAPRFPPRVRGFAYGGAAGIAIVLLGSAWVAAYRQQEWEYPIVHAINAFARRSALLDRTMHALTSRDLLQGAVFIALIWYLWFSAEGRPLRGELLTGTIAASFAGVVSRAMQLLLPTHIRPLHQAQIDFVLPFGSEPDALNHFNSFPSDHGAVFFTLCAVIWRVSPKLGAAAFGWAAIIDFARVYEGFHFPSDVVGSIGLGLLVLAVFQKASNTRPVTRVLAFEQSRSGLFYLVAFLITFQIATLFDDAREIGRGLSAVLLHHDVFSGS